MGQAVPGGGLETLTPIIVSGVGAWAKQSLAADWKPSPGSLYEVVKGPFELQGERPP